MVERGVSILVTGALYRVRVTASGLGFFRKGSRLEINAIKLAHNLQ
jgi:hypothetical protein